MNNEPGHMPAEAAEALGLTPTAGTVVAKPGDFVAAGGPIERKAYDPYVRGDGRLRKDAIDIALRSGGGGAMHPDSLIGSAEKIARYLRDGVDQPADQPAPGAILPPDFVAAAQKHPEATLFVLQGIMHLRDQFRVRDMATGAPVYTSDDEQTNGRLAYEAAAAIMPDGSQIHDCGAGIDTGGAWVDRDKLSRRDQLLRGVSLAIAEIERLDRLDAAAMAMPEMTSADWDRIHHAIGRPRDPMQETHRNYYSAPPAIAATFDALPLYWFKVSGGPEGKLATYSVTREGREALAAAIKGDPGVVQFYEADSKAARP